MLRTVLHRSTIVIGITACGALAGTAAAVAAGRGAAELDALPVQAVGPTAVAPGHAISAACPGSQVDRCYDTGGGHTSFVNVGTFFDRRSRTASDHFLVKLLIPSTPGRYQIRGFSFLANRAGTVFPSAGVVLTSASTPIFPSAEQLTRLQVLSVVSEGPTVETCADLTGKTVILESGQAAWLVLNFPDAADSVFIGVQAETDTAGAATDHECDFLTRDGGEYWYRPDPRQSPYDWVIAAYYDALPSKQEEPWTRVKLLYR
jgi:hypothetical protein